MNTEKMLTKSLLLLTVIAALTAFACSESQPKVDAVNVKFSEMMLLYIVADKNSTLSQDEFDDWLEKEFEMVFPSPVRSATPFVVATVAFKNPRREQERGIALS